MNLVINLLFAHLIGDFFLQPKAMAVKKGASNWIAAGHCAIYTLAIAVFTNFGWRWLTFVFVSHFIVDRFSLADKWLQLIRGRDLANFYHNGEEDIPLTSHHEMMNYRILRGAFSAIVYVIVDGTMHLASLYYAYPYLT